MKAKVFLFVCLFIGIATLSVNAQDKANKADQGWYRAPTGRLYIATVRW